MNVPEAMQIMDWVGFRYETLQKRRPFHPPFFFYWTKLIDDLLSNMRSNLTFNYVSAGINKYTWNVKPFQFARGDKDEETFKNMEIFFNLYLKKISNHKELAFFTSAEAKNQQPDKVLFTLKFATGSRVRMQYCFKVDTSFHLCDAELAFINSSYKLSFSCVTAPQKRKGVDTDMLCTNDRTQWCDDKFEELMTLIKSTKKEKQVFFCNRKAFEKIKERREKEKINNVCLVEKDVQNISEAKVFVFKTDHEILHEHIFEVAFLKDVFEAVTKKKGKDDCAVYHADVVVKYGRASQTTFLQACHAAKKHFTDSTVPPVEMMHFELFTKVQNPPEKDEAANKKPRCS